MKLVAPILVALPAGLAACGSTDGALPDELARVAISSVQTPGGVVPAEATFAFEPGSELRWNQDAGGTRMNVLLRDTLNEELQRRGLRAGMPGASVLRVAYVGGFEGDLGSDEMQRRFGFSSGGLPDHDDTGDFEKASLVLLVADGSGRLLWRASATGLAAHELPEDQRRERLGRVIGQMLQRMPIHSAP